MLRRDFRNNSVRTSNWTPRALQLSELLEIDDQEAHEDRSHFGPIKSGGSFLSPVMTSERKTARMKNVCQDGPSNSSQLLNMASNGLPEEWDHHPQLQGSTTRAVSGDLAEVSPTNSRSYDEVAANQSRLDALNLAIQRESLLPKDHHYYEQHSNGGLVEGSCSSVAGSEFDGSNVEEVLEVPPNDYSTVASSNNGSLPSCFVKGVVMTGKTLLEQPGHGKDFILVQVPPCNGKTTKKKCKENIPAGVEERHYDNEVPAGNWFFEECREKYILEHHGTERFSVEDFMVSNGIRRVDGDGIACTGGAFVNKRFFGVIGSISKKNLRDPSFPIYEIRSFSFLKDKINHRWKTAVRKHSRQHSADDLRLPKRTRRDSESDVLDLISSQDTLRPEQMLQDTLPGGKIHTCFGKLVAALRKFAVDVSTTATDDNRQLSTVEAWAEAWAQSLRFDESSARELEGHKAQLWKFLRDLNGFPAELVKEQFSLYPNILRKYFGICLPMERAQVLLASPSLHDLSQWGDEWYSDIHLRCPQQQYQHPWLANVISTAAATIPEWTMSLVRELDLKEAMADFLMPRQRPT